MQRVAVLGAGMAGLTTAIAAADAGAEVTLVERAPHVGGSMAMSGGGIWAPRDFETVRAYIPKGNPDLQRMLVDGLRPLWAWYEDHALPLLPEASCMEDDIGCLRMMALGELGDRGEFAAAMLDVAARAGVRLLTSTEVESLAADGARWVLHGSTSGTAMTLPVDSVVFATGGFQNDRRLLKRYATPHADDLVIRSNTFSDGAALRLLEPHGVGKSGAMSSFYGHTLPYLPNAPLSPRHFLPASQYYSDYSVLLNQQGLRFTDESVGMIDEFNAQQGSRQPSARYWLVLDEAIRRDRVLTAGLAGIVEDGPTDPLSLAESLGACVLSAPTIEKLAALLDGRGVPAENVVDSISAYNGATDPMRGLYPPRSRNHQPLVSPPYIAVECVAGITYTMGGVRIDTGCRVLRNEGGWLEGVHAAGADAGGVFHDIYAGGLAWAGVTGRAAGSAAAARR